MKKYLVLLILILTAAACSKQSAKISIQPSTSPAIATDYTHLLKIGGQELQVEIAKTPAAMQQGLSDRSSMQDNQGMLFDFGDSASLRPGFWMKDMDFALDFIWIASGTIAGITPNISLPANCQPSTVSCLTLYYPPSPVNQVLEVNAGWTEKNNIKTGDSVRLVN